MDGSETFYYVDEEKKPELEYYKNSIIHCFISHAFVAVSLLTGTEEVKTEAAILADYDFLKKVFKNEFVYDVDSSSHEEVGEVTAYFLDASFIIRSNGGYGLTRLGFDKLPIWAGLAKTFIESYWVASRSLANREKKIKKEADLLKNMNYLGLRFHKLGLIDHVEAISQVNFKNAIRFINEGILRPPGKSEEDHSQAQQRLSWFSQRLSEFCHYSM